MARISNGLITIINILTLLVSFVVIGIGAYFSLQTNLVCQKFLHWPVLILGIFLLVISILGIIGSCCRVSFFLWIYLFAMFMLSLAMVVLTVFVFIVTNKGVGDVISGHGYKEYRLGDYSSWLLKQVGNYNTWSKIESCLKSVEVCHGFTEKRLISANEFYKKNLSPIQSGCCKPPTYCGYDYVNVTYWQAPRSGLKSTDADCKAWSNNQEKLCYSCNSCKAGVLATLKTKWKEIAIFNVAIIVFFILVYTIGCCAMKNSQSDRYRRQFYGHH
ncbi:tetraspanin-8-like [Carex rostrata]